MGPLIRNFPNKKSPVRRLPGGGQALSHTLLRNRLAIWKSCFLMTGPTLLLLKCVKAWGVQALPRPLPRALHAKMNLIRTLSLLGAQRSWGRGPEKDCPPQESIKLSWEGSGKGLPSPMRASDERTILLKCSIYCGTAALRRAFAPLIACCTNLTRSSASECTGGSLFATSASE